MPYIGHDIAYGELQNQVLGPGNGSTTAYTLAYTVANPTSLLVTVDNVLQKPSAYTVSGTTLTFTSAPPSAATIDVRYLGRALDTPIAAVARSLSDADSNTLVQVEESADENTIRFDIAGAEDFTMTANSFNVLAGSQVATNTIAETTSGSGVTIDGLVIKDGNANLPDLKLQDKTLFALQLNLNNAAGTLKHSEYRDASNTSVGDYAGGLNNATGTITVTPTGTDSSTAMAAGMKISSASTNFMLLDTDVPVPADTFLIAAIIENTCSPSEKSILCVPEIINRNVNGTTAKRFELIHKDTTGAAFALNTTNIASGKALKYQFIGMLV